ncbi:DUF2283 domain-containing protein [Leptospira licerasiae]|uniref:PF10049 family protein n=1 Tax=Leptospira licerasiae str. MMD4847 TaxID=1049971 RepID=A0ABN0H921_9LEPT|nr:DUF2283 domain-containing protein [Leptospira licerasiae]EID99955.1 PF10049 family protein [Leptospira licerasiae serovar Varillal str. VAR 010]EJZ41771.1 PF10049 family protein [Leptospira licerasiae str. MMD4847]
MKVIHYPETDSVYIDLADRPSAETREVSTDLNIDLDAEGKLVGIDIHGNASKYVDLSSFLIETIET